MESYAVQLPRRSSSCCFFYPQLLSPASRKICVYTNAYGCSVKSSFYLLSVILFFSRDIRIFLGKIGSKKIVISRGWISNRVQFLGKRFIEETLVNDNDYLLRLSKIRFHRSARFFISNHISYSRNTI